MTLSRSRFTFTLGALALWGMACSSGGSEGGGGATSSSKSSGGSTGSSSAGGSRSSPASSANGGSGASAGKSTGESSGGGTAGNSTDKSSGGATSSAGAGNSGSTSDASSGGAGKGGTSGGGTKGGGTAGAGGRGGTTAGGTTATGPGGSAAGASGGSTGGSTSTGGSIGPVIGQVCPARTGGPAGVAPLPSSAQVSYQRTEMTSFIHYGLATYDGQEQCSPNSSPSIFNPSKLDETTVGKWISALKEAGARQSMLVTKHSCGFTLWPSQYTSHSVKSSPWQGGKGDVVKLFTDAMKANDMRIAWYLSPWDSKYTSDKADYETYFKNHLTELFAYALPVEVEFDGFHAPTSNVNWKNVFSFIRQASPNTLIWAGPEIVKTGAIPDLQWIGNENGTGSRSTSSVDTSNCGGSSNKNWCAWECNTSTHRPEWFWHPNSGTLALADLQKVYFQTVGMNCTLNLNVPPSNTGEFDPKDVSLLSQLATWYNGLYKTNLLKGQPATADSTWATAGFEAGQAADDDICTYWAAASGTTKASITVTPASPITVNLISIREPIEIGERTKKYHVELMQNGSWVTSPTDKSGTKIQGTVIGNRQLWQLNGAKVEAMKLVIDDAKDSPAIAEFSAY